MRRLHALAVVPLLLAAGSVLGSGTRLGLGAAPLGCAAAMAAHHAALVVEHGDGAVTTVCVAFPEDQITGDELLQRSQVPYQTADYGAIGKAVCQIQGEPASYPPGCWTASSPYWAMFVSRGGGGWGISNLGISSQTFRDGDAQGFRYEGQSDQSTPPSPAGVCPPAAPVVTPGPVSRPPTAAPSRIGRPTASSVAISTPSGSPSGGAPNTTAASTGGPTSAPNSPTVAAPIGVASTPPAQPPPSAFPAGPVAAAIVGGALLLLLAYQTMRIRRGPTVPPARP